jgi:hypothetical protein
MRAAIPDMKRTIATLLLIAAATLFVSCASQKQASLVNDPDDKPATAMPWNKQEKWETGSTQFAGMTDRR